MAHKLGDKNVYRNEFPGLGIGNQAKSKTSKADKNFAKALENSLFDQGGAKSKKPVKFSDNMKEIMRAEHVREMKKMGIVPKS